MAKTPQAKRQLSRPRRRNALRVSSATEQEQLTKPRYPTTNVEYLKKAIKAVGQGKGDHGVIRRYADPAC